MKEPRLPGAGVPSTSTVLRCNAVCDRFEAAWRAFRPGDSSPLPESFLVGLAQDERSDILRELILLDVHYRRLLGERCSAAHYAQQYPWLDADWLAQALKTEAEPTVIPTTVGGAEGGAAGAVTDGPEHDATLLGPGKGPPAVRYTLDRLHATGGIGQVWIAQDHAVGRKVALKELRPDRTDNADLRTRFLAEARITGQLEHPGIIPVYEVAWDPNDGQPFYTMRFVNGRTLRDAAVAYHKARDQGQADPLELRSLLDVMVSLCNVLAYAHSRGVLHRDLKGQNVILGDYGEVFLLDWGLAKIVGLTGPPVGAAVQVPLAQATPSATLSEPELFQDQEANKATAEGNILGTPGYMSPEQAAGHIERMDERTDVYGLGAVLYEILTGKAPFRGTTVQEILPRVVHEAPAAPRSLNPGVDAALESICLKALSKAPENRFASAKELGQELRRYQAGEPVHCYPDPWTVRLRRWTGRHRTLVTGTAVAALVALVSLGAAALLLNAAKEREHASRLNAEDNLRLAQQVVDRYLVQVSDDERLKSLGMEKLRRDLLLQAKSIYEQFVQRGVTAPALLLERARALHGLGLIENDIGNRGRARELYEEALAVYEQLPQKGLPQPEVEDGLAATARDLGVWYFLAQQPDAARAYCERALAIHRHLAEQEGATPAQHYQLALTLQRYGLFGINNLSDTDRGLTLLQEAVPILKRLVAEDEQTPAYAHSLASCYLAQSNAYRRLDRLDQVGKLLEEALKVRERLNHVHPEVPNYQKEYANTLMLFADWRGLTARRLEERKQAIAKYEQAFQIFEKLAYYHPDVPEYDKKRATIMLQVAAFYMQVRQPAPLKDALDKALPLLDKMAKENATDVEYKGMRFNYDLAAVAWHVMVGGHAEAAALLKLRRGDLGQGQWNRDIAGPGYLNIACYYCLAAEAAKADQKLSTDGRKAAAERYLTQALDTLEEGQAAGYWGRANTIASLKNDPDLKLLRGRPEFGKWLKAFEAGAGPGGR